MNFFKRARRLSQDELKTLASLCAGAAALVFCAVFLSASSQLAVVPHIQSTQAAAVTEAVDSTTCAAPDAYTYICTTPGTYTFTIPAYASLTAQAWGGGGGGARGASSVSGGNGGDSSAGSVVAHGGGGGGATSGVGGSASGGQINTTGNPGSNGNGGSSPSGGAGGLGGGGQAGVLGAPGKSPGGGGGGGKWQYCNYYYCNMYAPAPGGGGGGYAEYTYQQGALTPGSTMSIVVGAGGTGPTSGCVGGAAYCYFGGGAGASGEVYIIWTPASGGGVTPPSPTVTITGTSNYATASGNSIIVTPGQEVDLVATFGPSGSYTGSAIDNYDNTQALTSQDASSPKMYSFNTADNPATAGQSYLFNANVETGSSWANNYGQQFTINVVSACPANCPGSGAPNCIADNGYTYNSSNNTCTQNILCPANCPGTYPSCTANSGYTYNSLNNTCNQSVACPANCPGTYPSCTANSGYTYNSSNNSCTLIPPSLTSFSATPSRVDQGSDVQLSWTGSYLPSSCTLSSNPGINNLPPSVSSGPNGGTVSSIGPINQATQFNLSCGSAGASIVVNLIPSYQEK